MDKPTKLKKKLRQIRKSKRKKQINKVVGLLNNVTGNLTEMRFFQAFENATDLPVWFHRIIKSSKKLDRKGVDAIAETDCGHFFLQIKSSEFFARAFKEKHEGDGIGVVVPLKKDTPEYIRYQTIRFLTVAREERLKSFKELKN